MAKQSKLPAIKLAYKDPNRLLALLVVHRVSRPGPHSNISFPKEKKKIKKNEEHSKATSDSFTRGKGVVSM